MRQSTLHPSIAPLVASAALAAVLGGASAFLGVGCGLDLKGELVDLDAAGGTILPSGSSSSSSGGGDGGDPGSGDDGFGSTDGGSSSSGGGNGEGGAHPPAEGGTTCNYTGTWATKLTIAVNWTPQGLTGVILAPGSGSIQQWVLSSRVQTGTKTTDTAVVCGVALPDFSGTAFVGGETYGVRFPNSLFDNDYLPSFTINGTLSDSTARAKFSTSASAALLGLTLANPTTASWPSTITTEVDVDQDGFPGVTVNAASGAIPGMPSGDYSNFPVDVSSDRANQLFIAIRQVTQLTGAASDCDHISGTVTIPQLPNANAALDPTHPTKSAIDSHVIGCNLVAGGTCSSSQISFIDGTQPVFTPSGSTEFTSVRMPGATCSDVRSTLP
jgi:hypothetical protein